MKRKNNELVNKTIQENVNQINYEIFESLDDKAIYELIDGGYDSDIDALISDINEETFNVLDVYNYSLIDKNKFSQIDYLGDNIEEIFRQEVLNYFILSALNFPQEINWHHIEWGMLAQKYTLLSIIAAREHSKSLFFSFAYPIWKMYRYEKDGLEKKVSRSKKLCREGMLITNETRLARKFIKKIKEEIEYNEILRNKLLPENKDGWGIESLRCKNGAELSWKTAGQSMRGPHPTWIIVDDYLDKSVLYSNDQREKFNEIFYSEIMNMKVRGGQLISIGTPFCELDLLDTLKKDPEFTTFEYPAIFPDGSLLDDTNHSVDEIISKKDSQGSLIFSREILVKPISDSTSILPYTTIAENFDESFTLIKNKSRIPKEFVRIVGGVDLARSAEVGADYTVFITLGVDNKDNYWLLNIWREKGKPFREQISALKYVYQSFRHDVIIVENNQMQQFFVDESIYQNIPVFPHTTGSNKMDLDKGFPSLTIVFEQGKIKIPRGDQQSIDKTDALATELASMTWTDQGKIEGSGAHDDMAMGLYMAILAARKNTSFGFDMI